MRYGVLLLLVIAGVITGACGRSSSADTPPNIRYGRDIAECGMIIADPRYAAGITQPGRSRLFVDVGEMVVAAQVGVLESGRVWVHDYDSQAWLDATNAFFVSSDSLRTLTPMGSGVIAFKSREAGESFLSLSGREGTLMTWNDILSQWRMPGFTPPA